jgi:hypothetical protein
MAPAAAGAARARALAAAWGHGLALVAAWAVDCSGDSLGDARYSSDSGGGR